jgi:hypothetical protein
MEGENGRIAAIGPIAREQANQEPQAREEPATTASLAPPRIRQRRVPFYMSSIQHGNRHYYEARGQLYSWRHQNEERVFDIGSMAPKLFLLMTVDDWGNGIEIVETDSEDSSLNLSIITPPDILAIMRNDERKSVLTVYTDGSFLGYGHYPNLRAAVSCIRSIFLIYDTNIEDSL